MHKTCAWHFAKKYLEYSSLDSHEEAESDLVNHWQKSLFIFLFKYWCILFNIKDKIDIPWLIECSSSILRIGILMIAISL